MKTPAIPAILRRAGNRKYWKHALIGVVSIFLLFVILVNLAAIGAVVWLRSESGQGWVQSQISAATAGSGYNVAFSTFSYAFPQGLRIRDLQIGDADGMIAQADYITLRPKILPLAARQAALSVESGTLVLHRLPKGADETPAPEETQTPFALAPFTVPDLYFTHLSLANLRIHRLEIGADVAGQALVLSPDLYTGLDLHGAADGAITLDLDWRTGAEESGLPLPERIELRAHLNSQTLKGALDKLSVNGAAYTLDGGGTLDLSGETGMDITLNAAVEALSALGAPEGHFSMDARISGSLTNPAINAQGVAALDDLAARGLDDIRFALQMEDPARVQGGSFTLSSAYQDKPVELATDILREGQTIRFDPITGTAPALALSGSLQLDLGTMLAKGKLALRAEGLKQYSQIAGLDLDGSGTVDLTLDSKDGRQGAAAALALKSLRYQDIRIDSLAAKTSLPDVTAGLPDMLDLDAAGLALAPDVKLRALKADLKNKGEDRYTLSLDTSGFAMKPLRLNGNLNLGGLQAGTPAAKDIKLDVRYGGSDIALRGDASLEALDIKAALKDFKLSSLPAELPQQLQDLRINGDIKLTGTPALPVLETALETSPFSPVKGESITVSAQGGYAQDKAQASFEVKGARIKRASGNASLAMHLALSPFAFAWVDGGALAGVVDLDADLAQIATLFLPPGHETAGAISAQVKLAGTIEKPDIGGHLTLADGSYVYEEYGAGLHDVALAARFTTEALVIERISAGDREKGTLQASGQYHFTNPAATSVTATIKDFHVVDSQRADGYLSADLALRGMAGGYALTGDIALGHFDIAIPEQFQTSIPHLNIVEKTGAEKPAQLQKFVLDIAVTANDKVFVRGWGLDAEFGGNLEIKGDLGDPQVHGNLASRRGRYEEFGRRFTLEQAALRFQGSVPPSPYLDIKATHPVGELMTHVNLGGSVQAPEITLSSVPTLPEDEVMAYILFGKEMSRITPFQAIQLKNTLDRFSGRGGGGFDPLGMLRGMTGLDDIRVEEDADGNASVGVGKYLTDKVYMELEQGAGEASGAASIQVEVTPSISVETQIGQDAQAGGGVLWRWDY